MSTTLGEYMLPESPKILGHGAFAVVFLGVHSKVHIRNLHFLKFVFLKNS